MTTAVAIYIGIVLVISIVCFVAYGWDKRSAAHGSRRVPEQTLHILALLGGWPGALLGQRHFRHKTKKLSFLIVFWCVVVLHVTIVGAAMYLFFGNKDKRSLACTTNVEGYGATVKPSKRWTIVKAGTLREVKVN